MSFYEIAKSILPASVRTALKRAVLSGVDGPFGRVRQALEQPEAQPEPIREAVNQLLNEIRIDGLAKEAAAKFDALAGRNDLKLHLGAGADLRNGWVNLDLVLRQPPEVRVETQPDTFFINYDLRRGLPLADATCEYIYSSHFLEHLECRDGQQLMRECYRVLRPGGVFRASLPNFRATFAAYLGNDREYLNLVNISEELPYLEPGTEVPVDGINYSVYQNGEHKCIYDQEKIIRLLERIGFGSVAESAYEEGIDPSNELRRKYSFYVEAVK